MNKQPYLNICMSININYIFFERVMPSNEYYDSSKDNDRSE